MSTVLHCYKLTCDKFNHFKLATVKAVYDDFYHLTTREEFSNFVSSFKLAKLVAKDNGWEGRFTDEHRVFWLPSNKGMSCGFILEKDINGFIFVLSPIEILELNENVEVMENHQDLKSIENLNI